MPRARTAAGAVPRAGRLGVRPALRWLHGVLGLVAAVGMFISGASGSALVFRSEIDRALDPELLRVVPGETRAPLQAIVDDVGREFPEDTIARIRMPHSRDGSYEIWLGAAPSRYVYADPYTGAILGSRAPTDFLTGWLFLLHSQLLAGQVGKWVAGVGALILVLLAATGLVVWWPRRAPWRAWRQWRASLTVEHRFGVTRATHDLHRALGFYSSVFLLLAGVTGASLIFYRAFERAAYWVTFSKPASAEEQVAAPPSPAAGRSSLPLDSLLHIAERSQPGGAISYLYFPSVSNGAFGVRKRLPGEEHPNGKSFVYLDPTDGGVLSVEDGSRAPRGARLYSILYPIHIGVIGGVWTRVLAVLVGLSLATLPVTGVAMWWRRKRRGARR
ncbi:MAG TPA: PepSY-associated TM helix domain-containing protein [Gemmatimonadaceae bacterium]|nr:PepSY-associated TM helix domain-containing protein [Gemmatimonadaceae bacterium]